MASPAPGNNPGGSAIGWPSCCDFRAQPWPPPIAVFFFNDTATTEICTLSLHDALPIWFSGLFSKHRSRMNVILGPLRSSLRYGHNGPCFVRFRGRLTLQTPRTVEHKPEQEPHADPVWRPLPQEITLEARPSDGRAVVTSELSRGRPP